MLLDNDTNDPTPVVVRGRELLNQRARRAIRDLMSGTLLREIDEMWQDEGFAPPTEDPEPVGGERVTRFQAYLNQVDWAYPEHVSRAIRVFEVAIRHLFNPPETTEWDPSDQIARLRRLFAKDGYTIDDVGTITGGVNDAVLYESHLADLDDPSVLRQHLERIDHAITHDDPAHAIGAAKELIESVAKLVLRHRGVEFNPNADVPKLVNLAEESLQLLPKQAVEGPDSSTTVRQILGSAVTITRGITELRNSYGTGHGRDVIPVGLSARHARLAENGARLWCQFIMDTLHDPKAPWRRASA